MIEVQRIPTQKYADWRVAYFADKAKSRDQRLGQAFLNDNYPQLSCPELFYQPDTKVAESYIYRHFVYFENPE